MTIQEKATSLTYQFFQLRPHEVMDDQEKKAAWQNAKTCAIIAVKEIIEVLTNGDGAPGSTYSNPGKFYWQQVLKHLETL